MANPAISTAPGLPARIGRFTPLRVLGKGGQGVVYLARDPTLGREVAIKTLARGGRNPERLLNEARNVARLDHPGIVPLYEVELENGVPHLVYQFAPGMPLRQLIEARERPAVHRLVRVAIQLLDAMAYAHARGVLHRDLTPANVLVDEDDRPRILDFGVSIVMAASATTTGELVGTVNYLPPEAISNGAVGPRADLYAIGIILHELLTGRPLFSADNRMAVIYKILHEPVLAPSVFAPACDPRLDAIVLRALAREPEARYPDAATMKAELEDYLAPVEAGRTDGRAGQGAAVEFLLRRMSRKPDFPAVSRLIAEINHKSGRPESDDVNELSNVILKDYALTTKLLKLVNSAVYGQYGGSISTVSRAVLILGFDAIRAAALSIAIFEHLKNGAQADALKDAACSAFLSAVLAKELGQGQPGLDVEEAFIGAMFHRLGRHLAIYYFPDEYDEIKAAMAQRGASEHQAVREVLGVTYAEFGLAVARQWNFPERLVAAMTPQRDGKLPAPTTGPARVAQLASFANEVAEAVGGASGSEELERRLTRLGDRYGSAVALDAKGLREALGRAVSATRAYADVLTLDVQSAAFFKKVVSQLQGDAGVGRHAGAATADEAGASVGSLAGPAGCAAPMATVDEPAPPDDRKTFLVNAIAELASALLEQISINEVFNIVLEAFYRAMAFSHVMLLIRDPRRHMLQARLGFGEGVEQIVPRFGFKAQDGQDIFNESMRKGKEFVVLDVDDDQYRARVPGWCRELTNPQSVLLFPLIANKACIGLVYADKVGEKALFTVQELKLLNTLIKQASLAFSQRR